MSHPARQAGTAWSPGPNLGCTKHLPPRPGPHWKGLASCNKERESRRTCFTALNGLRHVACDSSSTSLSCRTSDLLQRTA